MSQIFKWKITIIILIILIRKQIGQTLDERWEQLFTAMNAACLSVLRCLLWVYKWPDLLWSVYSSICVCCRLPRTQGRIIHSTVVGGGPCKLGRGEAMCCEAKKSRKRKVR